MELQLRSSQRSSERANVVTVSPSSFVQQGTVDWSSLARASVTASVSVLSRLSGCGVEPWTATIASVIFGTIRLSVEGESHVNEALEKLYSFGSHGNLMYFGFGLKHIVRTLAETSEGMSTVAICACVSEVHGLAISTQIIQRYSEIYSANSDGTFMPSARQWEALVNACSGVLSRSPFGSVVEFFMKFRPQVHLCGDPKQVAWALEGLAKISSGLMKSMTLIGNSECGFIAAVAHWLLALRVVVRDVTGEIVYPSTGADVDDYQLMIIYTDNCHTSKDIKRTTDTYYINSISDILPDSVGADFVSGRIPWDSAFGQTFGSSARRLHQIPDIIGEIVGSAAKIYTIMSRRSALKSEMLYRKHDHFGGENAGHLFIDSICKRFPEFLPCQDAMDIAVERSDDEACSHFENAMGALQSFCGCRTNCHQWPAQAAIIDLTAQAGHNIRNNITDSGGYCLRLLVLTLVQLARYLVTVSFMPADLYPKRRGLECLYEQVQKSCMTGDPNATQEIQDIAWLDALDAISSLDLGMIIFGVERPFAYHETEYTQYQNRATVVVNGGLCFIMSGVTTISSNAEDMLRIQIVPGHIEWKDKTYTRVRDGKHGSPRFLLPPLVFPESKAKYEAQMQLIKDMTVRAVITESSECLRMSYEIKTPSNTSFLAPGALSEYMSKAVSGVSCSGKRCQPFNGLEDNFLFTAYGMRLPYDAPNDQKIPYDMPEKANIILLGDHDVVRCTTLGHSLYDTSVIMQDKECIACCARRALRAARPHKLVIVSRLTAEDIEHMLGDPHRLIHEE